MSADVQLEPPLAEDELQDEEQDEQLDDGAEDDVEEGAADDAPADDAPVGERLQITVPARALATAWVNSFLASSQEADRPVLYRTLSLEFFRYGTSRGVQIVGCDGAALFRSWVPAEEGMPWPSDHARPDHSVICMDLDGFGLGFMRALLRVTNDDAHAFETIAISTLPHDGEANLELGPEFQTERLALRACGQRIDLRLYEDTYVGWRHLQLGVAWPERVDGMRVATRIFGLIGKLKGVTSVELEFHGENRHVAFRGIGTIEVRGMLAPMPRRASTASGT